MRAERITPTLAASPAPQTDAAGDHDAQGTDTVHHEADEFFERVERMQQVFHRFMARKDSLRRSVTKDILTLGLSKDSPDHKLRCALRMIALN